MFEFEDTENQTHIAVWSVPDKRYISPVQMFLLSYEDEKRLLKFRSIDEVINHLYTNGFRQMARDIHAKNKSLQLEKALKSGANERHLELLNEHLEKTAPPQ